MKNFNRNGFGFNDRNKQKDYIRANLQIRGPQVRVIQDNRQLGIMSVDQARKLALEAELDLIEVVPNANPPVCHIVELSKFKWEREQQKKEQEKKNKSKLVEIKEIRLTPVIDDNDIQTKINSARKFITSGKKVKVSLIFKKRQIVHKEIGMQIVSKFVDQLKDIASFEKNLKYESNNRLSCILEPIKEANK